MVLHSPLSKYEYLETLQENMGGHCDFGSERFTGFFIGSCFYVTHHTGYDWEQRYTNLKNAAMGYVKKKENGCEVHFCRFRGLLCPLHFLTVWLIMGLVGSFGPLFETQGDIKTLTFFWILAFAATLLAALISVPFEGLTYAGEEGRRCLLSILLDPNDPYANIKNVP